MHVGEGRAFGKLLVGASKVLLASPCGLAVAFSELRPILPGHAVVAPTRQVERFSELSSDELTSLMATVRSVQRLVRPHYGASAFNLALHDGAAAGQPTLLPHVHFHVVPRRAGDLEQNDAIYDMLGRWSPQGPETVPPPFYVPSDEERLPRTAEQMAAESRRYAAAADEMVLEGELALSGGTAASALPTTPFMFANIRLDPSQLFFASPHCVAAVNLKPLAPGHVLVLPRRCVATMDELTPEELDDLWSSARNVEALMAKCHAAAGCKLAVQDGTAAGQSVPHVHVHVLPQGHGAK